MPAGRYTEMKPNYTYRHHAGGYKQLLLLREHSANKENYACFMASLYFYLEKIN